MISSSSSSSSSSAAIVHASKLAHIHTACRMDIGYACTHVSMYVMIYVYDGVCVYTYKVRMYVWRVAVRRVYVYVYLYIYVLTHLHHTCKDIHIILVQICARTACIHVTNG